MLYNLLIEELTGSYHRDVNLSSEQSLNLLHHILSRDRETETYPFPFKIDKIISLAKDNKSSQSKSQTPNSKSNISQSQAASLTLGVHAQTKKENVDVNKPDEIKIPEWKCFIKGGDTSSLTLTFIPASFCDVILLNKSYEDSNSEDSDIDTEPDNDSIDKASKDDKECKPSKTSGEDNGELHGKTGDSTQINQENSDLSAIDGNVKAGDKEAAEGDIDNAQPEEIINPNVDEIKKGKPLIVPVYIYDCLVHNVLQSLINPWDHQPPADIYQDMTFDNACEQSEQSGLSSPRSLKRVSFSVESLKVSKRSGGQVVKVSAPQPRDHGCEPYMGS